MADTLKEAAQAVLESRRIVQVLDTHRVQYAAVDEAAIDALQAAVDADDEAEWQAVLAEETRRERGPW